MGEPIEVYVCNVFGCIEVLQIDEGEQPPQGFEGPYILMPKNRAAEVENERDAYLCALTEYLMACPPDYQEKCDMKDCARRTIGCWKRWAKEQACEDAGETNKEEPK